MVQAPFAVALAEALAPRSVVGRRSREAKEGGENENDSGDDGNSEAPIGRVFLQSDVEEVASSMRDAFEAAGSGSMLEPCRAAHGEPRGVATTVAAAAAENQSEWESWAEAGWLPENPFRVPTEREVHTLSQGLPVYRCLLVKKKKAS